MKSLAFLIGAMLLSSPAFAAGIDSRDYTCAGLQSLITAQGFVFISQPIFGDFVVSNISHCSPGTEGGGVIQLRSVPTRDNPQCAVKYCVKRTPGASG